MRHRIKTVLVFPCTEWRRPIITWSDWYYCLDRDFVKCHQLTKKEIVTGARKLKRFIKCMKAWSDHDFASITLGRGNGTVHRLRSENVVFFWIDNRQMMIWKRYCKRWAFLIISNQAMIICQMSTHGGGSLLFLAVSNAWVIASLCFSAKDPKRDHRYYPWISLAAW